MSENVFYPPAWDRNAEASASRDKPPLGGGRHGSHDPGVEARVTALETDMKGMKAGIGRLEVAIATIGGRIDMLVERMSAHGEAQAGTAMAIRDLSAKVDAKLVSGGQMFGMFAGLVTLLFVLGGIAIGALKYFGLLH